LFNRPRDWPDIAAMLEAGTVDASAALDWVRRLVGEESVPYVKLAELYEQASTQGLPAPGSEMERPVADWQSLGGTAGAAGRLSSEPASPSARPRTQSGPRAITYRATRPFRLPC